MNDDKYRFYCDKLHIRIDATKQEIKNAYDNIVLTYVHENNEPNVLDEKLAKLKTMYDFLISNYDEQKDDYFKHIDPKNSIWTPFINEDGKFVDFYNLFNLKYTVDFEKLIARINSKYSEAYHIDKDVAYWKAIYHSIKYIRQTDNAFERYMYMLQMFVDIKDHYFWLHDILNITQNTLPSEIENILDKRLKDEQNKSETNQKIVKNFCLQAKFILLDPQRREEYEKQMFESLDKELNKKIKHVKKSTRQIVSSIFITTLLILILIAVILINKK